MRTFLDKLMKLLMKRKVSMVFQKKIKIHFHCYFIQLTWLVRLIKDVKKLRRKLITTIQTSYKKATFMEIESILPKFVQNK